MKKILLSALMATAMFSAQAEDAEIAEAVKASFSGVYFGGGFHFMNMQDYADYTSSKYHADMENSTKGRIGGTVLLGIGKKFESIPFYVALEASLDFAPNIELYGKDRTDENIFGYVRTDNTGMTYLKEGATPVEWNNANAADIYRNVVQFYDGANLIPQGEPTHDPAAIQYFSEMTTQNTYSIKIRRNGMNPGVGLRVAWASDLLKSLAYVKVGAYFTKDKFRYTCHQYMNLTGKLHTFTPTEGDPWTWTEAMRSIAQQVDEHEAAGKIESKVGSVEIFNSKVAPELTVGIEKRAGNIGMRLEGGYIFASGAKTIEDGDVGTIKFKKKGSCVIRLLGVWNLNLFK